MLLAAVCLIVMLLSAMCAVWGSGSRGPVRRSTVVVRAERAVSQANRAVTQANRAIVSRANVLALDEHRVARATRRASHGGLAS
jgi:hypothetical protein